MNKKLRWETGGVFLWGEIICAVKPTYIFLPQRRKGREENLCETSAYSAVAVKTIREAKKNANLISETKTKEISTLHTWPVIVILW